MSIVQYGNCTYTRFLIGCNFVGYFYADFKNVNMTSVKGALEQNKAQKHQFLYLFWKSPKEWLLGHKFRWVHFLNILLDIFHPIQPI